MTVAADGIARCVISPFIITSSLASAGKKRKLSTTDKTLRGALSGEVDLKVFFDVLHKESVAVSQDELANGRKGQGEGGGYKGETLS